MALLVYPAGLPGPQLAPTMTPDERRIMNDAGNPQEFRAVQRDFGATETLFFLFTAVQAALFRAWWKSDLRSGGAWFSSSWPSPQGGGALTRKFSTPPKWDHIGNDAWRVSCTFDIRGAGLPPATSIPFSALRLVGYAPLVVSPASRAVGAASLTFTGRAPSASIGPAASALPGAMVFAGWDPILLLAPGFTPGVGRLVFTGAVPLSVIATPSGPVVAPANGGMTLSGLAPSTI